MPIFLIIDFRPVPDEEHNNARNVDYQNYLTKLNRVGKHILAPFTLRRNGTTSPSDDLITAHSYMYVVKTKHSSSPVFFGKTSPIFSFQSFLNIRRIGWNFYTSISEDVLIGLIW